MCLLLKQDIPYFGIYKRKRPGSRDAFFVEDKVVGKIASGRCDFCENGEYKLSDWTDNG
ncbi:hypothetical protein C1A50_0439 [Paenibacillus polymyxa]|nr:hypothetical protein C1A50_0439 [Paenibacillus polymyxa]